MIFLNETWKPPEERMGEGKEVAAERIYLGNAGKKNKKGRTREGMIMGRRDGIEMEKEDKEGSEEAIMMGKVRGEGDGLLGYILIWI